MNTQTPFPVLGVAKEYKPLPSIYLDGTDTNRKKAIEYASRLNNQSVQELLADADKIYNWLTQTS